MMKKKIISVALLTVLCLAAVSCQKENIMENNGVAMGNVTIRSVSYTIDGVTCQKTIKGDAAWQEFLCWMMSLARNGSEVSFRDNNATDSITLCKETHTFVTKNYTEAVEWADKMYNEGYTVNITFDENTKDYICVATR